MHEPSLLGRLKERKLVQWALAYLAGAWVIYEATGTALEAWDIPVLLVRSVHVLLLFGLPLTLILAWFHGEKGRQRVSGPELLMVASVLMVAGIAVSLLQGGEDALGPPGMPPPSLTDDLRPAIAVLPLDDFSPDPADAYFANGMHEELITRLSKIAALRVISRNSVMPFQEDRETTPQVAAQLGVDYILEGSARVAVGQVRLTAQLIRASPEEHLWAENYDQALSLESLFSTQSDIAQKVAHAIGVALTREEQARIEDAPTEDLEAYELYLLGRYRWVDRGSRNLREAIGFYEAAIEKDSTFALAWSGLADAWAILPWYERIPTQEAYARGLEAAQRALELDEGLAEVHTALGGLALNHEWNWESAEAHLSRAIELDPNYAQAYHWLGTAQCFLGRHDRGIQSLRTAVSLNPLGGNFQNTLAHFLYDAGRIDEALAVHYRETRTSEPGNIWLAILHHQQGQDEEASQVIQRWGERIGFADPASLPLLLRAMGAPELRDEALTLMEEIRESTDIGATQLFGGYLLLDAPERALDAIRGAIARREVRVPYMGMAYGREKILEYPEILATLLEAGVPVDTMTSRQRDHTPELLRPKG